MFIHNSIIILIIGLSFCECIDHINLRPLGLDEAYLIVHNMIASDSIILLGNKVQCENCNRQPMVTVHSNDSQTLIIDTKYAYDLEIQSSSSNTSASGQLFLSYTFGEHGTYELHVMPSTSSHAYACSIEQTGDPSNYMAPAIVGIVFFVMYAIVVQIIERLYRNGYFNFSRRRIQHDQLINDDRDTIASDPAANATESREEIAPRKSRMSNPISFFNSKTRSKGLPSKRLHGLDAFRGFALMVMIFVNYGGMNSTIQSNI